MADFKKAFQLTMQNEGGFVLHKVEHDSGGWTFAGIAERYNPNWPGWRLVKAGMENDPQVTQMVMDLYKEKYWDKARLDDVESDLVAYNIFDFGVNAGLRTSVKITQRIVDVTADGGLGPITLGAINTHDEQAFVQAFIIAKVARYNAIVARNRTQVKFLHGWLNRAFKTLSL
ncbi:MAG: hypothetical protein N4A71_20175 [Carboxylicivirga sp.]|jgi:lysozyme family protein|nr:hypothetical protein [Carboxylicivirga sp.]